jgi:ABC-type proline/glycine betaine transport system ATPase subunit
VKKYFVSALFLLTTTLLSAHAYYFAFAELEYNELSSTFEGTIIVTTHDFEEAVKQKQAQTILLSKAAHDSSTFKILNTQLLDEFYIEYLGQKVNFNIIDFQLNNRGLTEIFVNSKPCKITSEFLVNFSLLMNQFNEQENKLTFIFRGKKETFSFTPLQLNRNIKLEN